MASITVKKGEDINRAIKRFKRKVEKEGIMKGLFFCINEESGLIKITGSEGFSAPISLICSE